MLTNEQREKRNAYMRQWAKNHREYFRVAARNWKKKHPEYARKYAADNRAHTREKLFNQRYGMTLEQYESLFEQQNGICAICKKPGKLEVDHDHATQKVRGLLCKKCNMGIGYLMDDVDTMLATAEYIISKK